MRRKKNLRQAAEIFGFLPFGESLHRLDRFVARGVDGEYARKARDFENLLYVLAQPRKRDFARDFLELLRRRQKHAQTRAAYVFKLAAFHENFRLLFFEKLGKYLFEFGCRRNIESAAERNYGDVVYFFLCDFHSSDSLSFTINRILQAFRSEINLFILGQGCGAIRAVPPNFSNRGEK